VAIWLSLWPFRFSREETAFVAWVGLRGAVSLLLALLPLIERLPNGQDIFNSAFIVVLVSLLVQGWTIRPMARELGLIIPPTIGPVEKVELDLPGTANHELVVYHVVADSPVARGARIPRWARPSLLVRKGQSMRPQIAGRIEADDHVYLFAAPRNIRLLDRLFASPAHLDDDDKDFFGEFTIDARQPIGQLALAYGVELQPIRPCLSVCICWSVWPGTPKWATAWRSAIWS
jgi:cell volume regulation protein A